MPLSSIQRPTSLAARTYHELRDAVLSGGISPGERLIETDLAQRLGVSRTPVREALARLVADGMADALPSGGIVVRDIGRELADIYGLRQVLEGYAARLAADRITPAELRQLADLSVRLRACVEAGELEEQVQLNNDFHLLIARASRCARVIRMIDDYRAYFLNVDVLARYGHADMVASQHEHEAILQALQTRDGERAEALVRSHLHHAMAIMVGGQPGSAADAADRVLAQLSIMVPMSGPRRPG